MRDIKFVTSFSQEGYKLYGRAFLESFVKHVDAEILVYYETKAKPAFTHKNIKYIPLSKIAGIMNYLQAMSVFPVMKGILGDKRYYQYDVYKFCRKMFAQCDAATRSEGILCWIDADTVIEKDLHLEWVEDQFKERDDGLSPFCCVMQRPSFHLCASFVAWDMTHDQSLPFWNAYFDIMISGRFLLLPEWHDSFILQELLKGMELDVHDIAETFELGDGPVNVFDIVFKGVAHHKKGNIKHNAVGPQRYAQLIDIVKEVKPKDVVEIGTWNGGRAIEMFMAHPEMKSYTGFDLFEDATTETDEHEKNVKSHNNIDEVRINISKTGMSVHLLKGTTNDTFLQWLETCPDKVDLIYIDGGHAVETIKNDLNNALASIREGGTIVMDDWYEGMPDEDMEKWGCNRVLEASGLDYTVLPIEDPVRGGGVTKMVVINL